MAVILLKLIFSFTAMFLNLLTGLTLTVVARIIVQLIQTVKVSAEGSQRVFDQIKSMIRTCMGYLAELVMEIITAMFSPLFDIMKERVSSSLSQLVAATVELAEQSLASAREVPELLEAFMEMVGEIGADLLNNCNSAVGYVMENVLA